MLIRCLESKHTDWDDDIQRIREQASPCIIPIDSNRSLTPQPIVQVEMADFLVRADGEIRARTEQNKPTPPKTDSGSPLHSVSRLPLSPSTSGENISAQQSDDPIRPLLLTAPDFLYDCKAFKFLIFLDVSMAGIYFVTMLTLMYLGNIEPGEIFLRPPMLYIFGLTSLLGPRFIWFAFLMQFSRATKR
jgi:hypothetical protein